MYHVPAVSTVVARSVRAIGIHRYCGGTVMALGSEIKDGVPFQVCTFCDNIPTGQKAPFDQAKE